MTNIFLRIEDVAGVLKLCSLLNPKFPIMKFDGKSSFENAVTDVVSSLQKICTAEQVAELELSLQAFNDRRKEKTKLSSESRV